MVGSQQVNRGRAIEHRFGFGAGTRFIVGIAVAGFSAAGWGAEWSVQPAVGVSVGRESNPLLTTATHESSTVTWVTPSMRIQGRTELSEIDLGLVLTYKDYSTDQVEDADQQILSLNSFTQTSERTRLGLVGEFRRDNLRETVNTGTSASSGGDADVGLQQANVTRDRRNLRPTWTQALSEKNSVQFAYEITHVGFDNAASTGLVDFTDQNLALGFSHSINPRDSFTIGTNVSRYRASAIDNATDTTRLLVGFARAFSETSRGSISVGASKTKEDIAGTVNHASGFVLEATAKEISETMELDGTISHDVSPSGSGRSIQSDQLRMRLLRSISPTLRFALRATLLRNKVLEGSDASVDRRYYEVEPALEYQWTSQWSMRTGFAYRYQKFDADPNSANSNVVFVGVAYNWQRLFFGR
ncbi:MAG: hypothetical protein A2W18_15110 [Candidatus Muproteobacteria bacterium RBG_16_60_9]|uniref:Outer membrane beta-barrel protein n=1 Tax=Candidatus Muproteobacteria bacterium RBG_16_60_9 TaxID=1817755 RepID=A0A1F6UWA9_9PROT|nr:MAG: hypothetical protein A2W18_15110 [Candidatus Muproteobacteria bacterium RBG_16_60_9]